MYKPESFTTMGEDGGVRYMFCSCQDEGKRSAQACTSPIVSKHVAPECLAERQTLPCNKQ